MNQHTAIARLSTVHRTVCRLCVDDGDTLALSDHMKERSLTIAEIGLIAGTRVALGAGLGLLISDRFNKDQRRGAGWALLGIGILSTIPIVVGVIGKRSAAETPLALAS
jgi:hypothetical protein